ncbi:hypothetical protein [Aldersonia kunmingensis]|uniref:hypothetical protein n=1 Tax=Aldersonia kunmingensis TaxID=408066 RepID=UPI0008376DAB|nr:hypothetical protein [Aldersonia kunmingensis]
MSQQQAPEQEQQNPAPYDAAAPSKSRRTPVIIGAVVVALAVGAGAAWAVTSGGDDDSVNSAVFEAASTPAEKVRAAVKVMHDAGTVRSHATTAEGNTTETQADFGDHVIYGETTTARFGKVAVVIRGEGAQQVYIRYEQGIGPIQPNTWYRSADSTMTLASSMLDPKYFDTVISASPNIVESGTVDVDGTDATRYVVTLDKNAVVDYLGTLIKSSGVDVSTFRTQAMASLPDSVEYAIDDAGRIVQIVEGRNITRFDNFGKPIEVPTIDESTVVPMPTR